MIIWSNGNIAVAIAVLGKNNASGSLAHRSDAGETIKSYLIP